VSLQAKWTSEEAVSQDLHTDSPRNDAGELRSESGGLRMNVASLARDTYDRDVGVRAVFRDLASVAGEEGGGGGGGGGRGGACRCTSN
jgi:hypothetical protein